MSKIYNSGIITLLILVTTMFTGNTFAASDDKPFAERKVVLQITDDDPKKQTLVLNVANNLVRHYGPDKVDVEVVAFGPGLKLLFANNKNLPRIDGLSSNGVKFAACSNTVKAMTKKLGHEPKLNQHSIKVAAGVVRVLELSDEGYTLVRP